MSKVLKVCQKNKILLVLKFKIFTKDNGGVKMAQSEIKLLQDKLNSMIDCEDDYAKIYEMSVKLDLLIVQYYNEQLNGRRKNKNSKY